MAAIPERDEEPWIDLGPLLRAKLAERCTSLTDAFRKVDKSNNGFIVPADFEEVLRTFGLRVTRQSLAELMAKYDANHDGFVSYREFCAALERTSDPTLATEPAIRAWTAAERAEESLRRILYSSTNSITAAFLHIDKARDGVCTEAELAHIFADANIEISPTDLRALVERYDAEGDGQINIRELAQIICSGSRFDGHEERGQAQSRKGGR